MVVIAIIGVLVALLLPAVQAAREAARRSSCSNNLKNIGLAVLNHHDVLGHFPVSHGLNIDPNPTNAERSGVGWILNTLPQLEQQSLFDRFKAAGAFEGNFATVCRVARENSGLASTKNGVSSPELMKTQLSVLHCPSDPSVLELSERQYQWQLCGVARTNYKGVIDDTWMNRTGGGTFSNTVPGPPSGVYDEPPSSGDAQDQPDCHRDHRCRGIFFRQSFRAPVKIAKVTDGTSNTFMIGEDVAEFNWHSTAYFANGDYCSCNTPLNFGMDREPNDFAYYNWFDAQGFRSRHPGGIQFCLADGSVRTIPDSSDHQVFRAHCTRDGEEVSGQIL